MIALMHLEQCLVSSEKILTVLHYSSIITMEIYILKFYVLQRRLLSMGRKLCQVRGLSFLT